MKIPGDAGCCLFRMWGPAEEREQHTLASRVGTSSLASEGYLLRVDIHCVGTLLTWNRRQRRVCGRKYPIVPIQIDATAQHTLTRIGNIEHRARTTSITVIRDFTCDGRVFGLGAAEGQGARVSNSGILRKRRLILGRSALPPPPDRKRDHRTSRFETMRLLLT